ncbi:hypothetical protein K8I61_18270 [bacterium]|nr:hypothetical protein [bacterium]
MRRISMRLLCAVAALFLFATGCGCDEASEDAAGDAAYDAPLPSDDDDADFPAVDDDVADDDALDDDVLDDDADDDAVDDDAFDDDSDDDDIDDDSHDDDTGDDDTGDDDDTFPPPQPNPNAKADAFRLFYKERTARANVSLNRFALSDDAVAANAFGKAAVARDGDEYEVVAGPNDNNPFGKTLFSTWKLYQAIGGRELELSLIRMLEGIVFNEAVSGHPGLTTREAYPGWTRTMDGAGDTITRTKWGLPVAGPVTYPPALEQEILDAFYDGVTFTYRENPEEWMFNFKAVNELTAYAVTYVFDELDHDPPFLRQSDCCSSIMITQKGPWTGAYWGNQNSRDNFTDYAMGYIAAFEIEATPGLPADLAAAAYRAAEAARRTGDNIVAHDNVLMTVDEWHDYETLSPAGERNPDGEVEWQDLGSLASCQMAYVAHAISTGGLTWPVPQTPLPGAIETATIRKIFNDLGLPPPPLPVMQCKSIDDAIIGLTWREVVDMEIFGVPLWDVADVIAGLYPDLFPELLGSMMDDFAELMLGAVALCYYADTAGEDELLDHARDTLWNFIELQKIVARLVYGVTTRVTASGAADLEAIADLIAATNEMLYRGALYARMFGIDSPLEYFDDFARGDAKLVYLENFLAMPDTADWALITDDQIAAQVEARLTQLANRAPWRIDRYRDRFGYTYPVRRAGDGYEAIGTDGEWQPTENPRHVWFSLDAMSVWHDAALCVNSPETLDCTWAALGCVAADIDESGAVDATDASFFADAWLAYGDGAACTSDNAYCDGADTDGDGTLTADDEAFLQAATGCTTDVP